MKPNFIIRLFGPKISAFLFRHPNVLILLALVYFVIPIDFLPEAITGIFGYLDDLLTFFFTVYLLGQFKKGPLAKTRTTNTALSPYEILEISLGASRDEIKKAYRKKMAEYHPDKVAHLGKELRKIAEEKTKEIQEAYEQLTKN